MNWTQQSQRGSLKSDDWKDGKEEISVAASEIIRKIAGTGVVGGPAQIDLLPGVTVEFEVEVDASGVAQAYNVKRLETNEEIVGSKTLILNFPPWITGRSQTVSRIVTVNKLPKAVESEQVKKLFIESGNVESVVLDTKRDLMTTSATVTMTTHEQARSAVNRLNETYMESNKLEVSLKPSKAELDLAFTRMGVDPNAKPIVQFVQIAGPLTRIQGGRVFLKRHNTFNKIVLMNAGRDATSHEVWETFKILGAVANVEIGSIGEGGRKKCYISFVDPTLSDVIAREYNAAGLNDEYTKFNKSDVSTVPKLGIWEFAKKAKGLSFMGGGLWLKHCKQRRESSRPGRMPRHSTETCIYVMNIINGVTEQEMGKVFSHLGDVQAVKTKAVSGQCAVGFVYFDSKETVDKILKEYNESKLSDKAEWRKLPSEPDARPESKTPPAGFSRKRNSTQSATPRSNPWSAGYGMGDNRAMHDPRRGGFTPKPQGYQQGYPAQSYPPVRGYAHPHGYAQQAQTAYAGQGYGGLLPHPQTQTPSSSAYAQPTATRPPGMYYGGAYGQPAYGNSAQAPVLPPHAYNPYGVPAMNQAKRTKVGHPYELPGR